MNIYQNPEWAALLASICESPNDHLPRLVAADWLEEHGAEERAEFIRIMVANHAHGKFGLTDRLRELVRDEWCEPLAAMHHAARAGDWKIGWKWSRGFVAEVRCTLADWVGEKCRHCTDGQFGYPPTGQRDCPNCDGTGGRPAHGPRIVREHPVERVVLTDREPKIMTGRDWFSWGNMRGASAESQQLLPEAIWRKLEEQNHPGRNHWTVGFHTREAALDALSVVCLAWAKSQPVAAARKSPTKRAAESK